MRFTLFELEQGYKRWMCFTILITLFLLCVFILFEITVVWLGEASKFHPPEPTTPSIWLNEASKLLRSSALSHNVKHKNDCILSSDITTITATNNVLYTSNDNTTTCCATLPLSDFLHRERTQVKALASMTLLTSGIITEERMFATMYLTAAALRLPLGDMVETGVYVGTSVSIMMKVLLGYDASCSRKVYAFDSFEGLPPPTTQDSTWDEKGQFLATYDTFVNNMKHVEVYDETRLIIAKGWFNETCPISPVQDIAFLRLDGDLCASTKDAIEALYPRVVDGGYIYVDDYGSWPGCAEAIDEYRKEHDITAELHYVFESSHPSCIEAVIWRKPGATAQKLDKQLFPSVDNPLCYDLTKPHFPYPQKED